MHEKNTKQKARDIAQMMADQCFALRVRRLNRLITRIYDDALRPEGLTVAQLTLLVAIERYSPVQPTVLGAVLEIEKSTLSRNIRALEKAGWIRVSGKKRGKGLILKLTRSGTDVLEGAAPAWKLAQSRARKMLGPKARAELDAMTNGPRPT